jgi:hypothetical protein
LILGHSVIATRAPPSNSSSSNPVSMGSVFPSPDPPFLTTHFATGRRAVRATPLATSLEVVPQQLRVPGFAGRATAAAMAAAAAAPERRFNEAMSRDAAPRPLPPHQRWCRSSCGCSPRFAGRAAAAAMAAAAVAPERRLNNEAGGRPVSRGRRGKRHGPRRCTSRGTTAAEGKEQVRSSR